MTQALGSFAVVEGDLGVCLVILQTSQTQIYDFISLIWMKADPPHPVLPLNPLYINGKYVQNTETLFSTSAGLAPPSRTSSGWFGSVYDFHVFYVCFIVYVGFNGADGARPLFIRCGSL